jgi:hypothetical protein
VKPSRIFAHPLFWVFVIVFMTAYPVFLAVTTRLPPVLPVVGSMPLFEGAERLAGRVLVVSFTGLDCGAGCRQLEKRMFDLQHRGRHLGAGFHLVTFVVDGQGREAEMAERARSLRASPRAWQFLAGAPAPVVAAVQSHLADPTGLFESRWLVLVDQKGRIRAIYDAAERDIVKRVLIDAGLLFNRRPDDDRR